MSNDPFAEVLACHTALSGGSFPTTPSIGALVPVADVASNSDQDKPTHHSQGLFLAEFGADDWMPTNKSVRTQGIPSTRIASAQADTINLEEDPWDTMDMVGEMLKKGGVLLLWSAAELDLFMKVSFCPKVLYNPNKCSPEKEQCSSRAVGYAFPPHAPDS